MEVFIFLTCALCGVASGIVYDVFYIARVFVCGVNTKKYGVKDKIFTVICDVLYFAVFAAMFVFISVSFEFYQIRLYMLLGCAFGAIIYLKSLHLLVAFCVKRVYNKIGQLKLTGKKRHERNKTQ